MGIQLKEEENPFNVGTVHPYAALVGLNYDGIAGVAVVTIATWISKEAHDAGKPPVARKLIELGRSPREPILGEDQKTVLEPALPSAKKFIDDNAEAFNGLLSGFYGLAMTYPMFQPAEQEGSTE